MSDAPYVAPAQEPTPVLPPENVGRGLLFSLIAVPVGVILWTVIWAIGIISALVAFAVAAGAVWLYRKGSGGRVSFKGVIVIGVVTLATLILAFITGLVWDYAGYVGDELGGVSQFEALNHPLFWTAFSLDFNALFVGNLPNFGLALLFGVLGAFSVLRSVFKEAAAAPAQAFDFPLGDPAAGTQPASPYAAPTDAAAPAAAPVVNPAPTIEPTPTADSAAPAAPVDPAAPGTEPRA